MENRDGMTLCVEMKFRDLAGPAHAGAHRNL